MKGDGMCHDCDVVNEEAAKTARAYIKIERQNGLLKMRILMLERDVNDMQRICDNAITLAETALRR